MTDKVDLGSGWAKLRDPQDVSEKQRRPLAKLNRHLAASDVGAVLEQRAKMGETVGDEELAELLRPVLADDEWELLDESGDVLICALVEEWSFDLPITVESAQNLPGKAYRLLRAACDPLLEKVLGIDSEEDVNDPESPTVPGSV